MGETTVVMKGPMCAAFDAVVLECSVRDPVTMALRSLGFWMLMMRRETIVIDMLTGGIS